MRDRYLLTGGISLENADLPVLAQVRLYAKACVPGIGDHSWSERWQVLIAWLAEVYGRDAVLLILRLYSRDMLGNLTAITPTRSARTMRMLSDLPLRAPSSSEYSAFDANRRVFSLHSSLARLGIAASERETRTDI